MCIMKVDNVNIFRILYALKDQAAKEMSELI